MDWIQNEREKKRWTISSEIIVCAHEKKET